MGGGWRRPTWLLAALVRRDERPQGTFSAMWFAAKNLDENGLFSSASAGTKRFSSTFSVLERRAGDSGCWA